MGEFLINTPIASWYLLPCFDKAPVWALNFLMSLLREQNKEYVPHKIEHVSCPFCGGKIHTPHEDFGHKLQFSYVQCGHCSLVYLNPRPAYDEEYLKTAYDAYSDTNYHVTHGGELNEDERGVVDDWKKMIALFEKVLGRKGRILEVGCATGLFLLAAKEMGWETYGIDISVPMIEHMVNVQKIEGQAGQYHEMMGLTDKGKFDVIFSSHVIEHIPVPNIWMDKFKDELVDDGILCLQVPNQYSPERVFKRFLKKLKLKRENWEKWRTPDHLYEPHHKSMRYLIEKHGFKIHSYETYSRKDIMNEKFVSKIRHRWLKVGSNLRYILRA